MRKEQSHINKTHPSSSRRGRKVTFFSYPESEFSLLNVTINDSSFIQVTADLYAGTLKKRFDIRSGSHAIDISSGSLTLPSKHEHGAFLFTVIPRICPISVAIYDAHGDTDFTFSS